MIDRYTTGLERMREHRGKLEIFPKGHRAMLIDSDRYHGYKSFQSKDRTTLVARNCMAKVIPPARGDT